MSSDRWPLTLLLREALGNVAGPRARGLPLLGAAILIGVLGVAFAAVESVQFQYRLQHEASLGRNLVTISTSDPRRPASIDRASCEALVHDDDVERAGILIPGPSSNLPQLGTGIPIYEASTTLFSGLQTHGALIGATLRRPGPAIDLLTLGGRLPHVIVAAPQPAGIDTDSAVVVGVSPTRTTADSCIVVLAQTADAETAQRRLIAELRESGPALTVPHPFTEPQDPIAAYLGRPSQYLPYLLAAAGAIAAGVLGRLRTGEWAAYRLTGTSRRSLLELILLEQWLIAGAMVTAAALTVLVLAARLTSPTGQLFDALAAGGLWILVAGAMTVDIALRPPTSLAKER